MTGALNMAMAPATLNSCSVNPITLTVSGGSPDTLTDHVVVTFTAQPGDIFTRTLATFGGAFSTTSAISSQVGSTVVFTFPAGLDLDGPGTISFPLFRPCSSMGPLTATLGYQDRCTRGPASAANGGNTTDSADVGLFVTPSQGNCVGTLPVSGSLSIVIVVDVDADQEGEFLDNLAQVSSDQEDPNPANNMSTTTAEVVGVAGLRFGQHHGCTLANMPEAHLVAVAGGYVFGWTPPAGHWLWDPHNGNGFFNENSCHLFDAVCHLMGDPTAVTAEASNPMDAPSENAAAVTVRFTGGGIAVLTVGGIGAGAVRDFRQLDMVTANGQARLSGREHVWDQLTWCTRADDTVHQWVRPPAGLGNTRYTYALRHFFECIRSGRPPSATVQDGVRAVALAMGVVESIRTGRTLKRKLPSGALRANVDPTSLYDYQDLWDPRGKVRHVCTALAGHYGLGHIKEIALSDGVHIHARLAPLGAGLTDWSEVLRLTAPHLPPDSWVILEHVQTPEEGRASVARLRAAAATASVTLT